MRAKLIKRPKPPAPQLGGIVERPPGELTPWPNNPRTHSEKQLTKLSASMQEFGFTAPVLVDEAGRHLERSWTGRSGGPNRPPDSPHACPLRFDSHQETGLRDRGQQAR